MNSFIHTYIYSPNPRRKTREIWGGSTRAVPELQRGESDKGFLYECPNNSLLLPSGRIIQFFTITICQTNSVTLSLTPDKRTPPTALDLGFCVARFLTIRPVHLLRVSLLRVLESNFRRLPIKSYGHGNSHPLELRVCLSQTL